MVTAVRGSSRRRKTSTNAVPGQVSAALKTNALGGTYSFQGMRDRLSAFLGYSHHRQRDLYESFGYNRIVLTEDLWAMYLRNDIANRIVSAYPKATWRDKPIIRDEAGDSSSKVGANGKPSPRYSPFVEAVEDFFEHHSVTQALERADRMSGIGRYGILVMGFADGQPPDKPLVAGPRVPLTYLSPYNELNLQVAEWDRNQHSPRFGLPVVYTADTLAMVDGPVAPTKSIRIHHSRVIHLSEFLDQDDTFGIPRLLPIFNRLKDLEKVLGGAAETFWLTANRGINFKVDPEMQVDADVIADMKTQADEFAHNLRRYIVGQGVEAQVMGSESPDPEMIVSALMDMVAGATGIPKRILLGSEMGSLASTQDENNWSQRVAERRENYGTPKVLRPFINKMIATGNLPKPQGKWWVEWPDTGALGPAAEADIAQKRTLALTSYANTPGAEILVPPEEFRSKILGLDPNSEFAVEQIEPDTPDIPTTVPSLPGTGSDVARETSAAPTGSGIGEPRRPSAVRPPVSRATANDNVLPVTKSLYISRKVMNPKALLTWAKAQGIKNLYPAKDLHVTVLYCEDPVDWSIATRDHDNSPITVQGGSYRAVDSFGQHIVLEFMSDGLSWRNKMLVKVGAKHSYPNYRPHVSLSKSGAESVDLSKIQAYTGPIELGPEIYEEVQD